MAKRPKTFESQPPDSAPAVDKFFFEMCSANPDVLVQLLTSMSSHIADDRMQLVALWIARALKVGRYKQVCEGYDDAARRIAEMLFSDPEWRELTRPGRVDVRQALYIDMCRRLQQHLRDSVSLLLGTVCYPKMFPPGEGI